MPNHDFGHENMFFRKLCHKITYEDENNTQTSYVTEKHDIK